MRKLITPMLSLVMALLFAMPAWAVRTDIPVMDAPLLLPTIAADSADVNYVAADVANMNSCLIDGKTIVMVTNSGASPYTVTFTSAPDALGRTGDISAYSMAAGETCIFGPFPLNGWSQTVTSPVLYFQASNVAVKFKPIRLRF